MAYKNNELTPREIAAAQLYAYGIETSPAKLYAVAHRGSLEAVEALSDINASASRWLHSEKVQSFVRREKAAIDARQAQERKTIEAEVLARVRAKKDGSLTEAGQIDYSDPRNQLRKLNTLINGSTDTGETLDALKVMIAKQSDLAPEKKGERPVRVYVPMSCDACPLYAEAQARLKRKEGL